MDANEKEAGHGEKKSRLTELAIAALLQKTTIKAAAKKTGVDESTLRAWLKDAEFKAEYREARRRIVEQAVGTIQAASAKAVATLLRNLKAANAGVQIRAAELLITFAMKGVEAIDLTEEMEEMNKKVDALNKARANRNNR